LQRRSLVKKLRRKGDKEKEVLKKKGSFCARG
jgi:hypothetical protein